MIPGRVDCLQATYGRFARVCESLACFLAQDYPNRHLHILNNHPVPLHFDHPLVTIHNESGHATLGHCRQRLLDFAEGEFCRTWDDDDLFTGWAISQGVARIGNAVAWKPLKSFWCNGPENFGLAANAFEASITFRTHFVKQLGYRLGQGDEHATLMAALGNAGPASEDMGWWTPYLYRWGCGEWHASGTIGNGWTSEANAVNWQLHNNDVRPGHTLFPNGIAVQAWWRRLCSFLPPEYQGPWMQAVLGIGLPHTKPMQRDECVAVAC